MKGKLQLMSHGYGRLIISGVIIACDARHHFAEVELHSRSPSESDYIVQNSANLSAIYSSDLGA